MEKDRTSIVELIGVLFLIIVMAFVCINTTHAISRRFSSTPKIKHPHPTITQAPRRENKNNPNTVRVSIRFTYQLPESQQKDVQHILENSIALLSDQYDLFAPIYRKKNLLKIVITDDIQEYVNTRHKQHHDALHDCPIQLESTYQQSFCSITQHNGRAGQKNCTIILDKSTLMNTEVIHAMIHQMEHITETLDGTPWDHQHETHVLKQSIEKYTQLIDTIWQEAQSKPAIKKQILREVQWAKTAFIPLQRLILKTYELEEEQQQNLQTVRSASVTWPMQERRRFFITP